MKWSTEFQAISFIKVHLTLWNRITTQLEIEITQNEPYQLSAYSSATGCYMFLYHKNKWENCPQNQKKSQACSKVSAAKCWNFLGVPFWGAHEGARRYGGGVRRERDRYYIIAEKGFFQGRGDVSSFLKLPFLFTSWESFWNRTLRKDPHQ